MQAFGGIFFHIAPNIFAGFLHHNSHGLKGSKEKKETVGLSHYNPCFLYDLIDSVKNNRQLKSESFNCRHEVVQKLRL